MDRAYKRLSTSDIIVSPYIANKSWEFSVKTASELSPYNIFFYEGINITKDPINWTIFPPVSTQTSNNQDSRLIYNSIEKLYYANYISGAIDGNFININGLIGSQSLISGSYWNYPQSTTKEIRYFPTRSKKGILDGNWTISKICHDIYNPGTVVCTSSFQNTDPYGELVESSLTIDGNSLIFSQSNNTLVFPQTGSGEISYNTYYASNTVNLSGFVGVSSPDIYSINFTSTNPALQGAYNSVTLSLLSPNTNNISMSIYLDGTSYYNPNYYTINVLGIPREICGSKIKPGTFKIKSMLGYGEIIDDSNGNILFYSSSFNTASIGNIIYPHGMIIFTSQSIYSKNVLENEPVLSFKNEYIIIENLIKCSVRESEFILSQNPSILLDNSGSIKSFTTSSTFSPYVTTIGLYNDSQDLLAVAKLSQPLPSSPTTDMNIIINIDR